MDLKLRYKLSLLLTMLSILALAPFARAADEEIGNARLHIAGTNLVVSPAQQTVPFDTATIVETSLEGHDPELGVLPAELRLLGDFVGPEVNGLLTLETVPGEPFQIPRLRLEGEYRLENIRLVLGDEVLAYAEPRDAVIRVAQILLTSVSSRALTLDEIRSHGLVIDENNFEAINLTFAYGVAGRTFDFNMPLVYNTFGPDVDLLESLDGVALPRHYLDDKTVKPRFQPPRMAPFTLWLNSPVEAPVPSGGCDPRNDCRPELHVIRPLVGVILFPTEISLLHQFFSVALMVENGAPEADPAILRNLFATVKLPPGLRTGETEPPTLLGQPVPVKDPGNDGVLGTADDLNFLVAGAAGSAEVLLEGVKHGTHIVEFDIAGVLDGLPIGPKAVSGSARGAIAVRDPNLAAHIAHPQTVRADVEYPVFLTISNIGNAPVNLINLELPLHALSGVTVVGSNSRQIDTLLPGDSETVEFRVESQRTGKVISSSLRTGSSVDPSFEWSVRVGGGALSPDSLVLPTTTDSLPGEVVRQALALVGIGYSLAQSPPSLSSGLPRVSRDAVNERTYRLGQVGRHVDYGEPLFDALAILATEWLGARDGDWAWDQLRRESANAVKLATALGVQLDSDVASSRAAFDRFAATTHFLNPQAVLGSGLGMRLEVSSRTSGKSIRAATAIGGADAGEALRQLPFAELLPFTDGDLVAIARPEAAGYTARLEAVTSGTGELHLLAPATGSSALRVVRFTGLSLNAGGVVEVDFSADHTTFEARIDSDGDGNFEGLEIGIAQTLSPRPFQVLAAVQNTDVSASGHVVDVLFSEEIDLTLMVPVDSDRFRIGGNISNGGLVESEAHMVSSWLAGGQITENPFEGLNNPRVVQVVFDNPLSPFHEHTMTVEDVTSAHSSQAFGNAAVTVETRAHQAGIELEGTVYGADGQPATDVEVILYEKDLSGRELIMCTEHPTARTTTDAQGRYSFDYVRQTDCSSLYRVFVQDPATHDYAEARGRVRQVGTTETLDISMHGRGTVIGRITYEDGSVPEDLQVVVHNAAYSAGRMAHIGDNGNFDVEEIIVGTVTLAADDRQGNFAYATFEIPEAGAVVEQDVVIVRRPDEPPPGAVRGTVLEVGGEPVWNAWVALYIDEIYLGSRRTDQDGFFDFGPVPSGIAEIEVFTEAASVSSHAAAQVFFEVDPDRTSNVEILVRDDRGSIEGRVFRRDLSGQLTPVSGALVWADGTAFQTTSDATGYYRLDDVFAGNWQMHALVRDSQERTSGAVTLTSAGGVVTRDLYIDAELPTGGLLGTVLNFDGEPVSNALIHLAGGHLSTRWHHETRTGSDGRFVIEDLDPGTYGVHAMGGGGGGLAFAHIRFPGDTAQVTVRYRSGTIRGRTLAPVGENGSLEGVVSQIAYRKVEVYGAWELVVLPAEYSYLETEPDGSFEIEALAGPYELHIYNAFHGTAGVRGQIDFDGQVAEHEFIFQPNGDIRGLVLGHDGETPVAGARVEISGGNFSDYDIATDQDGRFHFPLVPPGAYRLRAFHSEGVVFRQAEVSVQMRAAGEQIDGVEIELPIQGTVSGWVETADGDPVPAAVVTLQESAYPWRKIVLNADQEGNYAFDNVLGGGTVTLYAKAPELGGLSGRTTGEVTFEAEDVLTAIRLEATGEVEGLVTTPVDGSVVERASVELVRNGAFADATSSDEAGSFRFRELPLGFYQARIFDPVSGRRGESEWVELAENNQVLRTDVELESRGTVTGSFIDGDTNSTLPGHLITLRTPRWFRVYATTGIDGRYDFGGIPEGDFNLFASDNSNRRVVSEDRTLTFEDEVLDVELRLEPLSQVTGRVHNPPGQPEGLADNVNVRVVQRSQVVGAGFDNPFSFEGIAPRHRFQVLATENGGLRRARGSGRIRTIGEDQDLDLTLQALGSVTVSVRDSFDAPVDGAEVTVSNRHAFGLEGFSATTGDDHEVSFADVLEGTVAASATHPMTQLRGTASGELSSDGQNLQLEIVLENTGIVRGQVLLADGVTPAAGASVALRIGNSRWLFDETDDAGGFELSSVPMGTHHLILQEDGGLGTLERFGSLTDNGQIQDWGTLILDEQDPQVLAIEPPLGARDLPLDTVLTVTFSEPMDAARQGSAVRLRTISGHHVPASFTWSGDQTQLTVTPTNGLASGTGYDLFLESNLYDLAGRDLGWRVRSYFFTADVIPPTVIDSLPRQNAVQVPINSNVLVTFSEPVDLASISGTALQLTDLTAGTNQTSTFQLRPGEREVLITPVTAFENDRDIQLTVQNVADLAGNVMSQPVHLTFWTPDHTLPELSFSSPAAGADFISGEPVTIAADATDNRGVASVVFTIGEWSSQLSAPPFTWTVPAPVVETPDDVTIHALVTDIFGNQNSFSRVITVTPRDNDSPPQIASECPRSGDLVAPGFEIPIPFDMLDDESIESYWLEVDGQRIETHTPVDLPATDGTFLWTPDTAATAGQLFALSIRARDFAGNITEHAVELRVPSGVLLSGGEAITSAHSGQAVAIAAGETPWNEQVALESLSILHAGVVQSTLPMMDIVATGKVHVQCGGRLSADHAGFAGGHAAHVEGYAPEGLRGSSIDAGGSHGGVGELLGAGPQGEVYDSVYLPSLGGAGGPSVTNDPTASSRGGGALWIEAANVVIDGQLSAIGEKTHGKASGGGGSIVISTPQLEGQGQIDAGGGERGRSVIGGGYHWHGAGGGGRVALWADVIAGFDPETQVRIAGGYQEAGPGTLLVHTAASTFGDLRIDNGDVPTDFPATPLPTLGAGSVLAVEATGDDLWLAAEHPFRDRWHGAFVELLDGDGEVVGSYRVLEIDVDGRLLLAGAASTVMTPGSASYRGVYRFDRVTLTPGVRLQAEDPLSAGTVVLDGEVELEGQIVADHVLVKAGAHVSPVSGHGLFLKLTGTLTVEEGAVLDVVGLGFAGGNSEHPDGYAPLGLTGSGLYAGGSHGGIGAERNGPGLAGEAFGSVYQPLLGGAGGGSLTGDATASNGGGGVIDIEAAHVVLEGRLDARGKSGRSQGAGGGGSVRIRAASLSGSGLIQAEGGNYGSNGVGGVFGGCGGGGRIALHVADLTNVEVATQASAQATCNEGGPGTLFIKDQAATYGHLIVDSGPDRTAAKVTPLPTLGAGSVLAEQAVGDDLWLDTDRQLRPRWLGAWVRLEGAAGEALGSFEVLEIDGQRALVRGAAPAGVAPGATIFHGLYRFDEVQLLHAAGLSHEDPLEGAALVIEGETEIEGTVRASELVIRAGAEVRPVSGGELRFEISGRMVIETGAVLEVNALGYPGGNSAHTTGYAPEGLQGSALDAGGSHGGTGQVRQGVGPAGEVFDSVYQPMLAGGGGSSPNPNPELSNAGGGLIFISAGELVLDGTLESKGGRGGAQAGGAGGTVHIQAATISGSGLIDASGGGNGSNGQGGVLYGCAGGGRVSLRGNDLSGFDVITGVRAVSGCREASPGTVYWRDSASVYGTLRIDSGDSFTEVPFSRLPTLGTGALASAEAVGSDLWVSAETPFRQRWLGAFMELTDSAGNSLGVYEVIELDAAGRALIAGAAAYTGAQGFAGEYRFDAVQLGHVASFHADDPVAAGHVVLEGEAFIPSLLRATDLTIQSGAVVQPAVGGFADLKIAGTLTIEAGAKLDLTGLGYAAGTSDSIPGGAPDGLLGPERDRGGSHGGIGGHRNLPDARPGDVFDSVYQPSLPGGGGSNPGLPGGGVLHIEAQHVVLEGEILADGRSGRLTNSAFSGGAGGSVIVQATSLSGTGQISAIGGEGAGNGFNGHYGSGGGGRIALYIDDLSAFDVNAQVSVHGGDREPAAPGTLFVHTAGDTHGRLIVDSGELAEPVLDTELPHLGSDAVTALDTAGGDAWLSANGAPRPRFLGAWVDLLDAQGGLLGSFRVTARDEAGRLLLEGAGGDAALASQVATFRGLYRFDEIIQQGVANLVVSDPVSAAWSFEGQQQLTGDLIAEQLTLRQGASLSARQGVPLRLLVSGTLTVEAGATIDASGLGYEGGVRDGLSDAPEGVRGSTTDAGGSHGGFGGQNGTRGTPGEVYGSVYQPSHAGAGGGSTDGTFWKRGSNGGGLLEIEAGEIVLAGEIRSRGLTGPAGGGAGGSVVLTTPRLTGSGFVDVQGGGICALPSSGGRVALYVDLFDGFDPVLQVRSRGGSDGCAAMGSPGTAFLFTQGSTHGDLIVAHDGTGSAATTPLPRIGFGTIGATTSDALEPAALWIEPADPLTTFSVGTVGMWVRVDGVDYRVIGERQDRRGLLLEGGFGQVTAGEAFRGLYKFDNVTASGGASLVIDDFVDAGEWHVDPVSTLSIPDREAPVIASLTPAHGSLFAAGEIVDIETQVSDNEAVTEVRFEFAGQSVVSTEAPFSWQVAAPAVTESTVYTVRVEARDALANLTILEHQITVESIPAGAPPVASILCPGDGAMMAPGTSLGITADASDDHEVARVEISLGGVLQTTLFAEPWTATVTAPPSATDGEILTLEVKAFDFGGQMGTAILAIPIVGGTVLTGDQTILEGDANVTGQSVIVSGGTVSFQGNHSLRDLIVLDGGVVTHPPTTPALEDGMVGYWSFNDGADPSQAPLGGEALLGTLAGGDANDPVYSCGGDIAPLTGNSCALDFTGDHQAATGQWATVNNHPGLDFTTAYTLSGWLRFDANPLNSWRPVFVRGRDDGGNGNELEVYTSVNSRNLIVLHNRTNGGPFDYVGFTAPPLDQLFHLAVTFDGTWVRAFYDGVEQTVVQRDSLLPQPLATGKNWTFGKVNHSDFNFATGTGRLKFLDGLLDEVRFFNRALDPQSIDLLSKGSVPGESSLQLSVTRDVFVACGGAIDVAGRGYAAADPRATGFDNNSTEGAGPGIGGSHGGRGGGFDGSGAIYGNLFDPIHAGGGGGGVPAAAGGPGTAGGGVVRLSALGTIRLDGTLTARGGETSATGQVHGAGGSIRLDAGQLRGLGEVDAAGGGSPSAVAGGGGGRVAIYAGSLLDGVENRVRVTGGQGTGPAASGAAGTFYLKLDSQALGTLTIDNQDVVSTQITELPSVGSGLVDSVSSDSFSDLDADFASSLVGSEVAFGGDLSRLWPITDHEHHGQSLTLDVTSLPLTAQVGDTYEGLLRFDAIRVAGDAHVFSRDRVESTQPADIEGGSVWQVAYAPSLAFSSPSPDQVFTAGEAIELAVLADDPLGVAAVSLRVTDHSDIDLSTQITEQPYSWQVIAPAVTAATTLTVEATALDLAGRLLHDTLTIEVQSLVDPFAPEVHLDPCPANLDLVMPGASFDIGFTATDNSAIESYFLIVDGVQTAAITGLNGPEITATLPWTVPADAAPGTVYNLTVEAADFSGGRGSQSLQLTVPGAPALSGDHDLDAAVAGQDLILGPGIFTATERLELSSLTLLQGATLRSSQLEPLDLAITGAFRLQCGSSIDVDHLGYAGGWSPIEGVAPTGVAPAGQFAGGSHGGHGIDGAAAGRVGEVFDSVYLPTDFGAGGARGNSGQRGGAGGGVVLVRAASVVLNGTIRANGEPITNSYAGGGAGGSIVIDSAVLEGNGVIEAKGGSDIRVNGRYAGLGGGGRIALLVDDMSGFHAASQTKVHGGLRLELDGTSPLGAAAGTLYLRDAASTFGALKILGVAAGTETPATTLPSLGSGAVVATQIEGDHLWLTADTPFSSAWLGTFVILEDASGVLGEFTVIDRDEVGRVLLDQAAATAVGATNFQGSYRFDSIEWSGSAGLHAIDPVDGGAMSLTGEISLPAQLHGQNLTVSAGSTVVPAAGTAIDLRLTGTLTVEAGATVDLDFRGHVGGWSPIEGEAPAGVAPAGRFAGGSHGGLGRQGAGAHAVGEIYDSVYSPSQLGAGGARGNSGQRGGAGGGLLRIEAAHVVLDGVLRASGEAISNSYAGAGAGGSINLRAESLRGTGTLEATGGDDIRVNGRYAGLGGGGRIAVDVQDLIGFDPEIQIHAEGGTRFGVDGSVELDAAAGTIFVRQAGESFGRLLVNGHSDRDLPPTLLPPLGAGPVQASEIDGVNLWISTAQAKDPRWHGAFTRLEDTAGTSLGSFRVLTTDAAGRLLLENAADASDATAYRGEYRFDRVNLLGGAGIDATDALTGGDVVISGLAKVPAALDGTSVRLEADTIARPATGGELHWNLSGALTLEAGSLLDLNGLGYAGGYSPIEGVAPANTLPAGRSSGGSHGGQGLDGAHANQAGEIYDSVYLPTLMGAGGGRGNSGERGGAGGGLAMLKADTIVLDGILRANGQAISNSYAGAGAGGTVVLETGSLSGAGAIEALGGDDIRVNGRYAGLGGGGRVAIYAGDVSAFDLNRVSAAGGKRFAITGEVTLDAAPGTFFVKDAGATWGDLYVDAHLDPQAPRPIPVTVLPELGDGAVSTATVADGDLWITGADAFTTRWLGVAVSLEDAAGLDLGTYRVGEVDPAGGLRLLDAATASSATTYRGRYRFDSLEIRGGAGLDTLDASGEVTASSLTASGELVRIPPSLRLETFLAKTGSVLIPGHGQGLEVIASTSITIEPGASLDVSGYGFSGGTDGHYEGEAPAGVVPARRFAGGGHGGEGYVGAAANSEGKIFDSVFAPRFPGGGGGRGNSGELGGKGGGVLRLETPLLMLDGALLARGAELTNSYAGTGAGGTVALTVGTLSGTGTIDVSGGDNPLINGRYSGLGGGGRALLDITLLSSFDPDTQILARGGVRTSVAGVEQFQAGAGTVLLMLPGDVYGQLIVDQGPVLTVPQAPTPLPAIGAGILGSVTVSPSNAADLWVEPSDPAMLFGHGVAGAFLRVGATDYRILEHSEDLRQVLLEDASTTVLGGESYLGVYKFDRVTLRGEARVELQDDSEVGVFDIGADAQWIEPGG